MEARMAYPPETTMLGRLLVLFTLLAVAALLWAIAH